MDGGMVGSVAGQAWKVHMGHTDPSLGWDRWECKHGDRDQRAELALLPNREQWEQGQGGLVGSWVLGGGSEVPEPMHVGGFGVNTQKVLKPG